MERSNASGRESACHAQQWLYLFKIERNVAPEPLCCPTDTPAQHAADAVR
jgi:hypothetical protein